MFSDVQAKLQKFLDTLQAVKDFSNDPAGFTGNYLLALLGGWRGVFLLAAFLVAAMILKAKLKQCLTSRRGVMAAGAVLLAATAFLMTGNGRKIVHHWRQQIGEAWAGLIGPADGETDEIASGEEGEEPFDELPPGTLAGDFSSPLAPSAPARFTGMSLPATGLEPYITPTIVPGLVVTSIGNSAPSRQADAASHDASKPDTQGVASASRNPGSAQKSTTSPSKSIATKSSTGHSPAKTAGKSPASSRPIVKSGGSGQKPYISQAARGTTRVAASARSGAHGVASSGSTYRTPTTSGHVSGGFGGMGMPGDVGGYGHNSMTPTLTPRQMQHIKNEAAGKIIDDFIQGGMSHPMMPGNFGGTGFGGIHFGGMGHPGGLAHPHVGGMLGHH